MQLGMCSFNTDYGIRPDEMARALEERGYESLWVPEHTHIPASRRTPWALHFPAVTLRSTGALPM